MAKSLFGFCITPHDDYSVDDIFGMWEERKRDTSDIIKIKIKVLRYEQYYSNDYFNNVYIIPNMDTPDRIYLFDLFLMSGFETYKKAIEAAKKLYDKFLERGIECSYEEDELTAEEAYKERYCWLD